eukprot:CAMPEP_0194765076 /NCGR_PEP_ID=MMETSP0323_2-20130528/24780_1 /TAXON_ID=2866 ORGANISM="Crypthecodinium cohnii, Strain Seligo" /NCGR_SAMPLE_ID=MMETSP0323_2 /ASSEMBLY_ACC=CAM_ASM_000346 /LENGTH=159 /DNA_ID=CAMNT_0039693677 /DNA_START=90 /DNA_END=569 /DNA_ORIENTATION=-
MKSASAAMFMALLASAAQAMPVPVFVEQEWRTLKADFEAWKDTASQSRTMADLYRTEVARSSSASTLNLASLYSEKPRDLLPIGEGAYQNPKAVEQRTKDPDRACEHGDEAGCYHADGADLVDGHSYGHLRAPPKSSAIRGAGAVLSVVMACFAGVLVL